jgi:hypothetical protein
MNSKSSPGRTEIYISSQVRTPLAKLGLFGEQVGNSID